MHSNASHSLTQMSLAAASPRTSPALTRLAAPRPAMAQRSSSRWKRKATDQAGGKDKFKSDLVMPKLPPNGYPVEHPFNKDGFRYLLAEPDPHAPYKQEFDDCQDLAGKPIPGWFFRKLMPPVVLIAMHDRAPQLKVSEDRLSVTGERGYCMARATHGAHFGTYYYEVTVTDMPEGSAARIGWSQELGNLQGPAGYDKFSYGWRSRKGTAFHDSRGKHFSDSGFRQGDTVGFLIHLPVDPHARDSVNRESYLPLTHKERPLVKFKSYFYFEQKDEAQKVSKFLRPLIGSRMVCFRNGEEVGTMFSDVNAGIYYPAASLYKGITLTFNFGPKFRHHPHPSAPSISVPSIKLCKPIQHLADELSVLQSTSDILYFTEKSDSLKVADLMSSFATHG